MTSTNLDDLIKTWSLARGPQESDDHLRTRILSYMRYQPHHNDYLKLCLLLARLGIKSAERDLPIGAL